jgi:hypothetical protein
MAKRRKGRQLPPRQLADEFDIFLQAGRIRLAAGLIGTAGFLPCRFFRPDGSIQWSTEPSRHFAFPSLVLKVFSLELALKCLLAIRGKRLSGHFLKRELFNKLPLYDRQLAREYFEEMSQEDDEMIRLRNQSKAVPTLDKTLVSCEMAFQTLRYGFEYKGALFAKKKLGSIGLHLAVDVFERILAELRPEWRERFVAEGKYETPPAHPYATPIVVSI